jgi:hypothetical protein
MWSRVTDALGAAHDAAVQMIDTSIIRVHQHGACITRKAKQSMGRLRGGLTSKIHALGDTNGLPIRLAPTRPARPMTIALSAPWLNSDRWSDRNPG